MSRENVDVVQAMFDAWNRRDVRAWLSFFHPDVEFSDRQAGIGMRDRGRGLDELERAALEWTEIFDEWHGETLALEDVGEFVLGEVRFHGRGTGSGTEVSGGQVDLYRVRDGKILEYRAGFRSRAEALDSAQAAR